MNPILSPFKSPFKPTNKPGKNALKPAQTSVNMGLSAWELLTSQFDHISVCKSLSFCIIRIVSL